MDASNAIVDADHPLDTILQQVLNNGLLAVDADSGSLMLVEPKQGILQIKARLGPPRQRSSEPVYEISGKSVASWVVQNRRPYLCPNIKLDSHFIPSRTGQPHFLSLLSVPIIHDGEVLAVINADAPEEGYFTPKHRNDLEKLAKAVAPQIAGRMSILDAIASVGLELMRLPEEGGVERVLKGIAEAAVRSLGADVVTLYQYDQKTDQFLVEGTGPTVAGELFDQKPMRRRIYDTDVPSTVVRERRSGFYSDVHSQDFLTRDAVRPGDTPRPRFCDRERIRSMAALLLPARASDNRGDEVVGVMFTNYRKHHDFNIDERMVLAMFADYASVAILNARRGEERRAEQTRSDQLAMVHTMSATFAHRMSDLAGTSRVATQLLKDAIPRGDRNAWRQLERIEREAEVLSQMARRIASPFRSGQGHMELIDVVEIVDRELASLRKGGLRCVVSKEMPAQAPLVRSIRLQLEQVVHDLLRNAVEAMEFTTRKRLAVRIERNPDSNNLEVRFTDNGSGIPASALDTLFTPFVSTKEGNLGIGLWWSRDFLRRTGGDIRIEHTMPGRGTTVLVIVPVADAGAASGRHRRHEPMIDVLIVEDSSRWRGQLIDVIKARLPCSVEVADGLQEATHALKTKRFKVAVLDVKLGSNDKGGLELLAAIEASGRPTKVIVLSIHPEHEAAVRESPRVLAFVRKDTLDVDAFVRLVQSGLGRPAPTAKSPLARKRVFVCYSHRDSRVVKDLRTALVPLERDGTLVEWHDDKIPAGAEIESDIRKEILRANVAVLLLSPEFFASHYIQNVELPLLRARLRRRALEIYPVLVREYTPSSTARWIEKFKGHMTAPLHRNPGRDQAFRQIAEDIVLALKARPAYLSSVPRPAKRARA